MTGGDGSNTESFVRVLILVVHFAHIDDFEEQYVALERLCVGAALVVGQRGLAQHKPPSGYVADWGNVTKWKIHTFSRS